MTESAYASLDVMRTEFRPLGVLEVRRVQLSAFIVNVSSDAMTT